MRANRQSSALGVSFDRKEKSMKAEDRRKAFQLFHLLDKSDSNALKAPELSDALGLRESATCSQLRTLARDAVVEMGLPIGSSTEGYFVTETNYHLNRALAGLESRVSGIRQRMVALEAAHERYQRCRRTGEEFMGGALEDEELVTVKMKRQVGLFEFTSQEGSGDEQQED